MSTTTYVFVGEVKKNINTFWLKIRLIWSYIGTKWYTVTVQSTLDTSNSKGLFETLRDIRTSKFQSCRSEENNKFNNRI